MNRFLFGSFIFMTLCCFSSTADAKELIQQFKGSESKTTADFEVKAPWIVDWRTSSDYHGQLGFQVDLVSSPRGEYQGRVVTTKWIDNGVKLFNESGRYHLEVRSNLTNWTLRIIQLSREEAEAYTPKDE